MVDGSGSGSGSGSGKTKVAAFVILLVSQIFVDGAMLTNQHFILHKGTVQTIHSDDGDVIDCVDINKQPAFNHPLLINHTLQMKPQVQVVETVKNNSMLLGQSWLKSGECPQGTIPIARTHMSNKHDGAQVISQLNQSLEFQAAAPAHEYAQVSIVGDRYYGARAAINLWTPSTNKDEFSIAQLWILSGHGNQLNSIEAGWMVNSGEKKTRFFIYWTSDNYHTTGCYNLQCAGFVQTNSKFALGSFIEPVSSYGGDQREIVINIHKDLETGNWWLELQGQALGYWPSSIFSGLAGSSDAISWGGEITNKNMEGHHTSTQMGSGHLPNEGFRKASFFRGIQYVDGSGTPRDPGKVIPYVSRPSCYDLRLAEYKNGQVGFYFGGPGYSNQCQ